MSLRKFRKQAEGLDLEKLNRGEVRRRKKKAAVAEEDEESNVGLRKGKGAARADEDDGFVSASSLCGRSPGLTF